MPALFSVSDPEARVVVFTLDNPRARNGLTAESARDLGAAIAECAAAPHVCLIVIRGADGHFCSGADLQASARVIQAPRDEKQRYVRECFHAVIEAVVDAPVPVLAAIEGACVGFGFDLAMACDLRLARTDAKFGQVFARIGLVPDGGSSWTLPRLVGYAKAAELMFLAETFDGREAARLGLVNRSVEGDAFETELASWTERLAAGPPIAYRLGKANLRAGAAGGSLSAALDREAAAQAECLESQDVGRGVSAFFAKQPPVFEGN